MAAPTPPSLFDKIPPEIRLRIYELYLADPGLWTISPIQIGNEGSVRSICQEHFQPVVWMRTCKADVTDHYGDVRKDYGDYRPDLYIPQLLRTCTLEANEAVIEQLKVPLHVEIEVADRCVAWLQTQHISAVRDITKIYVIAGVWIHGMSFDGEDPIAKEEDNKLFEIVLREGGNRIEVLSSLELCEKGVIATQLDAWACSEPSPKHAYSGTELLQVLTVIKRVHTEQFRPMGGKGRVDPVYQPYIYLFMAQGINHNEDLKFCKDPDDPTDEEWQTARAALKSDLVWSTTLGDAGKSVVKGDAAGDTIDAQRDTPQ